MITPRFALILPLVLILGCPPTPGSGNPDDEDCPELSYVGAGGAPTTFDVEGLLLGIDLLYPEYEGGSRFVLVDARPSSDFALHTIEGAISIPYYIAAECAATLPPDEWIVTFCACPHSLSTQAANHFIEAGHSKVKVLDEGYLEWRERGYPTTNLP